MSEGCYDPVHTVDAISAKYARVSAGRVFKYYVECNNNTVIQNPITELLNSSFYNALVINNTLNSNYTEINNYLSEQGYSGVCLVDMSHAVSIDFSSMFI